MGSVVPSRAGGALVTDSEANDAERQYVVVGRHIGFLVFCCVPMLFMGRHGRRTSHDDAANDEDKP